jgi:hypothetical protein
MDILESIQKEFDIINGKLDLIFLSVVRDQSDSKTYDKLIEERFYIDYEDKK